MTGTVRDFRWVPFALSIPRGGVWPCQLFIQSPGKNGRWVIIIHCSIIILDISAISVYLKVCVPPEDCEVPPSKLHGVAGHLHTG